MLAYFAVHSFSLLTVSLLSLLLAVFGLRQGKVVFIKTLPLLALCGLFFECQKIQWERTNLWAPEQVTTVQVIPDTIDVNGDSLSFRGQAEGQVFQVFYKLASQEEQNLLSGAYGLGAVRGRCRSLPTSRSIVISMVLIIRLIPNLGIYRTVKISTINNILPIHSWNIFDWLSTCGGRLSFISNHIFLLP